MTSVRDLTTLPSSIAEKIRKSEDIRNLKKDIESGYHVPKLKLPSRIHNPNSYNYKIVETGTKARTIHYSQPIIMGYTRKHTPERKEGRIMANEKNIRRARKNVFDIVETNLTPHTKMITLTYAICNLDYDQLAHDWKMFRRNLKRSGFDFPYLYIVEHQTKRGEKEGNRGSLHIHAILFTDLYIPFNDLKHAWGDRGSVHIEKLNRAENKGAYVAKYITKEDMPADKKAFRTSRDIKKPTVKVGLGDELDIINHIGKDFKFQQQDNYTVTRGYNQETGEVNEDILATVYKYSK